MKEIDLRPYDVTVNTPQGEQKVPFNVRGSIEAVLTSGDLRLNGTGLLRNGKISDRIISGTGDISLVEEADYAVLKAACDTVQGFNKNDTEFLRRIFEAPTVEVQKKEEA